MTAPLDWRKIEAVLVEWFRAEAEVGNVPSTGDKIAEPGPEEINLTALAKHLSDELSPPP